MHISAYIIIYIDQEFKTDDQIKFKSDMATID